MNQMIQPSQDPDVVIANLKGNSTDAEFVELLVRRLDLELRLKDWLTDELVKAKVKVSDEFKRGFERGIACAELVDELKERNQPWRLGIDLDEGPSDISFEE